MLDADAILTKSSMMLRAEGMPESEWLATAVRRLRATLAGRDVHTAGALVDDFVENNDANNSEGL